MEEKDRSSQKIIDLLKDRMLKIDGDVDKIDKKTQKI